MISSILLFSFKHHNYYVFVNSCFSVEHLLKRLKEQFDLVSNQNSL